MMSDTEIKQMVISQLTLVLETLPVGEAAAEVLPSPELPAQGLFDYSDIHVEGTVTSDPASIERLITAAVQGVVAQIEPQVMTALAYTMTLFGILAFEVKKAYPDVDVEGLLRRLALPLAAGDGPAAGGS
jgi:hypothetical protein